MCGEHDYLLFKRENRPEFPRLWQLQDMKIYSYENSQKVYSISIFLSIIFLQFNY